MDYSGKILLFDKKYNYIIKDFEMTIIDSRNELLRNHELIDIVNKWIETEINEEKKLIVKLSYKYSNDNAVIMKIEAYAFILDFKFQRAKKNDEIHKLSELIGTFDKQKIRKRNFKKYEFVFNKKKYLLYFGINSFLTVDNKFMFDVFNSLNIECEDAITIDEIYELSIIVKKFLSFISNSRKVYVDEILINSYFNENNAYKSGKFYIEQGEREDLNWNKILNYDYLKDKIGEIFDEIINDNICFVSLFQYDKNYISAIDIMNVCAAFEGQFDKTYPKYRDKKFSAVKKDIIENLEIFKLGYKKNREEQKIIDEIMLAVNNYKDILKSKLEYALRDFEKLYDTKVREYIDIKFDFKDNYQDMPTRIKNARNKLDHGNTKVKINYDVLTDTILLRAITYFMILKTAGVSRKNIMKCIRKFTRFGV